MQGQSRIEAALRQAGVPFTREEPMARHTTFQIGGPAALFAAPQEEQQLLAALAICQKAGVRYRVLGKGSNLLFADEGFDGVVLALGQIADGITVKENNITAWAGTALGRLCTTAAASGLAGLEFAMGIPGSVGGAVYMNAGAYGGEMKDVLTEVRFADETGAVRSLPADTLGLGYRTSIFQQKGWCILSAAFALHPDSREEIEARMADYLDRRRQKQPLELPSAGSTFKRPAGAFAAALIEQCGLKGYRVGGAAVSEKHSGFVVNLGGASCRDVLQLTGEVARIVQEKTGYALEREVQLVE